MTAGRALGILAVETKYEFLKFIRLPAYAVPVIAFPVIFYIIFGLAFTPGRGAGNPVTTATYVIATMGTFGVIGASMFGLGVSVAGERGQGWLIVKRASPMPMAAYFGSKILVAITFSAIIVALLFLLGAAFGHVRLPVIEWLRLGAALIVGAVPFCAMGLSVGYLAGPNSAQPIVNLIYLPLSFASGLWMPLEMLPRVVRSIAPTLPPFHLARLALGTVGLDPSSGAGHLFALGVSTLVFLGLATVGFARDEGKTYG